MDIKTITRRIDENGSISIPEEFRHVLNLNTNAKLDITLALDNLIITKSKDLEQLSELLIPIANILADTIEHDTIITDLDIVLAANKKKYINKALTPAVLDLIATKEVNIKCSNNDSEMVCILADNEDDNVCQLIVPIVNDDKAVGSIIVLSKNDDPNFTEAIKPAIAFSKYIANKM